MSENTLMDPLLLELPTRLITCLDRHGLYDLREIVQKRRHQLADLEGVGSVLLDELMNYMNEWGVQPGEVLPDVPVYPQPLRQMVQELSGYKRRWWTGKGVKMYRRFTPISGSFDEQEGRCVLDTGARQVTVDLSFDEGTVTCSCGRSQCDVHGLAAALTLAKAERVKQLFDRSIFAGTSPSQDIRFDPLLFVFDGHTRQYLLDEGIEWMEELAAMSPEKLTDVKGIGAKRSEQVLDVVRSMNLRPGEPPPSLGLEQSERIDPALGRYVFHLLQKGLRPERGVRIFQHDGVRSFSRDDDGTYHGQVRRNRDFSVTINPGSGTCQCDCSLSVYRAPCAHALGLALAVAKRDRLTILSTGQDEQMGEDLAWLLEQVSREEQPEDSRGIRTCHYYLYRHKEHWRMYVTEEQVESLPSSVYGESLMSSASVDPGDVQDPKDRTLIRQLNSQYFGKRREPDEQANVLGNLLPMFSDRSLWVEQETGGFHQAEIEEEEVQPVMKVAPSDEQQFQMRMHLSVNDRLIPGGQITLFSRDPAWILDEYRFYPTRNDTIVSPLVEREQQEPLLFSEEELNTFSEQVFPELREHQVSVQLEEKMLDEGELEPEGHVYLRDYGDRLIVQLKVVYGDMAFTNISEGRFPVTDPERGELVGIQRDTEREWAIWQQLCDTGLRPVSEEDPLRMEPEKGRGEWMIDELPSLSEQGFVVHREADHGTRPEVVAPERSDVHVTSDIDWFELSGEVDYGVDTVDYTALLEAIREGRSYVQLSEDQYGEIPERWMDWFRRLDEASVEEDTMRLPGHSMPSINRFLHDAEEVKMDQTVRKYRRFYREFEGIDEVREPDSFQGTLRDYQRAGLAWLQFLRQYSFGGILADDMGLGKTIQVLAHLLKVQEEEGAFPGTLVVAPRSVLANWQREARRFMPSPDVYAHHGSSRCRNPEDWPEHHLCLTTYGTMRRDVDWMREIPFDTIVLDESQAIRNPDTKTAKAARLLQGTNRLGLSGTPVQNTVMDLWSQFQFINPGLLGTRSFFEDRYVRSIDKRRQQEKIHRLRKMIHPFLLRRTKSQVENQLPELSQVQIDCRMGSEQEELYEAYRKHYREEISDMMASKGVNESRFKVFEGLMRLRQICCQPSLIDEVELRASAKLDRLAEVATEVVQEGHRALIFSQFVSFLQEIKLVLERHGWSYEYLDGSTRNRQDRVERFQEDDSIPFFLISLQAGGEGLNLTGADYVLLMDPWWNPAVEQQAMDRTHRIGQDQPVLVYRLICPDTIEEKMLTLQEHKKSIADNVVTPDSDVFKDMDRDDILRLFS